jgi:hypothetical protein
MAHEHEVKTLSLGHSAVSLATYSRRLIDEAVKHGGCTLNTLAYQANAPKDGFVVGGVKQFEKNIDVHQARKQVRDWLEANLDGDNYPVAHFVGSWVDSGNIWFDFCNITADVEDALNLARVRKELAIYDLAANESVFV